MRQLNWFYDIYERAWRVITVEAPELDSPNPGIAWSEDERDHAREWAVIHADR